MSNVSIGMSPHPGARANGGGKSSPRDFPSPPHQSSANPRPASTAASQLPKDSEELGGEILELGGSGPSSLQTKLPQEFFGETSGAAGRASFEQFLSAKKWGLS